MADDDIIRAGTVILKDLALFDQAAILFEERVEPPIRIAIGTTVGTWMDENGWKGESDVSYDFVDMLIHPANWEEDKDDPFAKFRFDYRPGDTSSYQIADLFGLGQSGFGFRFEPVYPWFGGKPGWNASAKTIPAELLDKITAAGWLNEGKGSFFRPVNLPAEHLAAAWESEDWTEALAPLVEALDALARDRPLFDRLIMRAKPKATKAKGRGKRG